LHLNSVHCSDDGLYFSGCVRAGCCASRATRLSLAAALPAGSHNAQPFGGGVIYNDTEGNRLCAKFAGRSVCLPVTADPAAETAMATGRGRQAARPVFARRPVRASSRLVAGRLLALDDQHL